MLPCMWLPRLPRPAQLRLLALLPVALLPLACESGAGSGSDSDSITLYTCVNDETIQPVISQFESDHSGLHVKLYRATTGDLNARIAADVRSGGLDADVVWACDPLTMQDYVDQGLVGGWTPDGASDIPDQFRTNDYVGVAVLYMVAVYHDGVPAPASWADLAGPEYAPVAVSDPNVAASALGAVGYFSQQPDYGLDFYSTLEQQGAKQVTSGVAQGLFTAGMTIANSAYLAKAGGSPIGVTWPEPGAVAIYGPIALATDSADSTAAQDFIAYVVSEAGQQVVAKGGSYPALSGVGGGPELPAGAPVVFPDWPKISANKDALLADYQQIFGG
jgi:iron(III) transport system substrate-binding protein